MRASIMEIKRDISDKHKSLLFGEQVRQSKFASAPKTTLNHASQVEPRTPKNAVEAFEALQEQLKKEEEEKSHSLQYLEKFVIGYNNPYKSFWDIIMMFIVIYSSVSSAYL